MTRREWDRERKTIADENVIFLCGMVVIAILIWCAVMP